ncbi:hypothetical protein [Kitasatospora sp. NBC_01539]|uniref:hypothetical protein n=1 Tax=Kitasatospora sp. NBC_01539 TaxID=2903577 RepID=UPI00386032AF
MSLAVPQGRGSLLPPGVRRWFRAWHGRGLTARRVRRPRHGPAARRADARTRRHHALTAAAAALGECGLVCGWDDWFVITTACRRDRRFASPSVFAMTALGEHLVDIPQDGSSIGAILDGLRRAAARRFAAAPDRRRAADLYRATATALVAAGRGPGARSGTAGPARAAGAAEAARPVLELRP